MFVNRTTMGDSLKTKGIKNVHKEENVDYTNVVQILAD